MNEENGLPELPPNAENRYSRKMMLLLAALSPSAIGIACVYLIKSDSKLWPLVHGLDLTLCVVASVGLVRDMTDKTVKIIAGFFLSIFFFLLNTLIVVSAGCSQIGSFAR